MAGCTAPKVGHKSFRATKNCPMCSVRVEQTRATVNSRPKPFTDRWTTPDATTPLERIVLAVDVNGYPHRADGPARRTLYHSGEVESEEWMQLGVTHSDIGPAVVRYFESGGVKSEEWMRYGKQWRESGPSSVQYQSAGGPVSSQQYNAAGGARFGVCATKLNEKTGQLEPLGWADNSGAIYRTPDVVMHHFVARDAYQRFGVYPDNEPAIAVLLENHLVMGGPDEDFEWHVSTPTDDELSVIRALYPNP